MNDKDLLSDKKLLECSKRNPRYFGYIYKRYEAPVYSFFRRRVSSKEVAMDLTQEVFMRAFRSRHRFVFKGYSYSAYLFKIANNLLVNYYRKKKSVPIEEGMEDRLSFDPSYQSRVDSQLVWKATDDLLSSERVVLEERYKKERSIEEIAKKLGKSKNAVKLILSRARKKLKRHPVTSGLK
ncbi:MAG: RNA polymerase sigma factor [Candidatus Paceibacterota bacterium]